MGEIVNVRCRACNREWQCFTGSGLLHGKKENILAAFSEKRRLRAEELMAKSSIPAYDFRYRLAVCAHCQNVTVVPVLQALDGEEICVGLCPLCESEVRDLCAEEQSAGKWSKQTVCPNCGDRTLIAEEGGEWD